MKKLIKILPILLAVIMFSTSVAMAAEIDPKVTFDGNSKVFSFTAADNYKDNVNPDLFPVLKGLIPGDKAKQNIQFEVKNVAKNDTVKIYVQSKNQNDDYTALLESINYTVNAGGVDVTGTLADKIFLGDFTADKITDIVVNLDIPVTVGNEIQDLTAMIDWEFTAEILTAETSPETGDNTNIYVILALLAVSAVAIFVIVKAKAKN